MIRFIPNIAPAIWARKSQELFDSEDDLRSFVADQRTKFYRFIGKDRAYLPEDVELIAKHGLNAIIGWKEYYDIMIDGILVGFCGD